MIKNYKKVENTLNTLSVFSNDLLETRFSENSTLMGLRLELTSGTLGSFELTVESKSDALGASYSKVFPFEASDTVEGAPIMDIEFLRPIEVSSGHFIKVKGETLDGMTGSEVLKVILYFI